MSLQTFQTELSAFNESVPTYDLFRKLVRLAVQYQVPKTLCSDGNKAYTIAITPEVEQFLHTVSRGTPPYQEFVYLPASKYRSITPRDNEVGAMHEVRFFLASNYDKPSLMKFVTDLSDTHTISCKDSLALQLILSPQIAISVQEYKSLLLDSLELEFLTEVLSGMPTDYSELIDCPEYDKAVQEINSRFED